MISSIPPGAKLDRSAFDVYIEYLTGNGKRFFGIEVKYAESLREKTATMADAIPKKHRERYEELASDSGYFRPGVQFMVRQVPYSHVIRDHLLARNMSPPGLLGSFIYLYPYGNTECHSAVTGYRAILSSTDPVVSHFCTLDLAACILTHHSIHDVVVDQRPERERYLGEKR